MLNIAPAGTFRNVIRPSVIKKWLMATAASLLAASGASAQVFNWNLNTSGNWNVPANWSPGSPTFLAATDETLNFGGFASSTTAGYTATNVGSSFTRVINFNNTYGSPAIVVAPGTTLTFNAAGGLNPSLNQNGFGLASIGAFTLGTASPFTIGGNGAGNITLSGAITNTNLNTVTINQTGGGFLGTGASVILSGTNNFGATGNTVITNGNVVLGAAAAFGSNAANTITINGGTFRINGGFTVANNFTLNSTMTLLNSNTFSANVFNGVLSGNGGIDVRNAQSFQGTFNNNNTFLGAINVQTSFTFATNLFLASTVGQTSDGRFSGTTSITLPSTSTLQVDNTNATTTAVSRLNTGLNLTLNRANFAMQGNATLAGSETINSIISNGQSTFNINPGSASATGAGSNLTLTTWTRNNLATASFNIPNLGNAPGVNTGTFTVVNNPGGAIGGILPYAWSSGVISTSTTPANTFVRWDGTTGRITPLSLATDYQTGALPVYLNTNTTAQYRQAGFTQAGLNGTTTVNSLILETSGAAAQFIGNALAGSGTLRVSSGAIISSLTGGTTAGTTPSTIIATNILDFGTNPGYFLTPASILVTSNITGSAGINRSGGGALTLVGTNTFTGDFYNQFGNLVIDRDANLGNASNAVRLYSGASGLFILPNALYTSGASNSLPTARNFIIGDTGAAVTVSNSTASLTITGTLSGTGFLGKSGAGTLILDPSSGPNTISGRLSINAGVLAVRNDGAIGAAGTPLEFIGSSTGIFQPLSSFTTTRNVLMQGPATFYTPGVNLQIDGVLGTQNNATPANLTKLGTGDLVLTSVNTYNGTTTIGGTGGVVVSTPGGAQTGGRLVLQGANGSAALSTSFTLNPGSSLVLDNTAGANNFRVGMVGITTNSAEIVLNGNASSNVTQAVGAFTGNSLGTTFTLSQPVTGGGTGVTTLQLLSYTASSVNTATVFFRGNNLGAGAGDRTAVVFNSSPALTANILPSAVGSASSSGGPTDFVTVTGGALQIFNTYVANNPNTGAATVTDINAATSLGAASTAGAARISTGGSVDLAGNSWTISTGHILTTATGGTSISNTGAAANLALGTNGRITNETDLTLGTGVTITGSAVTKFGNGVLLINQGGTTIASWNVAQGTVRYGAGVPTALPVTLSATIAPGATLDLNNNAVTAANIAGFGTVNIGTGSLTLSGNSTTFMGTLQGSGNITLNGANAFTVSGNNSGFSGNWNLNASSTLTIASNNALGTGTVTYGGAAISGIITVPSGTATQTVPNNIIVNTTTGTNAITMVAGTSVEFSGSITINNTNATTGLRLTGPASSTVVQSGAWTISGNITGPAGSGPISWFGGNWNLSGNNSFPGGFQIDNDPAMILGIGSNTALGTGPVTITTFGGFLRADNGARTLSNNITFNSATNNFGVTGLNDLTLSGTILLNTSAATHNINVINTGTTTLSGIISGTTTTAVMSQTGFGTLVLSNQNTFGAVGAVSYTLNSGVLGFGADGLVPATSGPIGKGDLLIQNGGVLRAIGGARTVNNPIRVGSAGSTTNFVIDGSNALTLGGTVNLFDQNRTIAVTNSALTIFGGVISGTTAAGALTKEGAGVLSVTAANTYQGGTTVAKGTLLVNNTTGSGTGTGAVTVNQGATLGGNGIITGTVTNNGTISPGNSPGKLSINNTVSFGATGNLFIEISGPGTILLSGPGGGVAGTDYDQLALTAASSTWSITAGATLTGQRISGYTAPFGMAYTIIDNTNTTANSGTGSFAGLADGSLFSFDGQVFQIRYNVPSSYVVDPTGSVSGFAGITWTGDAGPGGSNATYGGNIVIAAVPEPATIALMGLSGIAAFGTYLRLRRRNKFDSEKNLSSVKLS